ncbi:MAG: O-antigen ligase family protein [Pseudomonadales bacterium]|nr:O-antigen ligase family protein [Pseudomonadales bacterium]MBO7004771.1 O-antigen ligase family protein [Pseudomonadales bacterium]
MFLTCALYFLVESGSANSFPTYLISLAILPLLFLFPEQFRRLDLPLIGLAALFLAYLGLSVSWSESGESVTKHLGYVLLVLGFSLSVAIVLTRFRWSLYWLCLIIILAAVINCGYSLYLHHMNPEYQPLPEPRLFALGRLSNPVISALSYGFVVILCAYMVMTRERMIAKVVFAEIALLFIGGIVLTWTRAVWPALAAALIIGILLNYPGNRKKQLIAISVVCGGIVLVVLASLGPELLMKRAFSFRPEIWSEFVSRAFASNALIGVGLTSDSVFHLTGEPEPFKHPHSLFVSTFFYGGLIGLILYIALLALAFRRVMLFESHPIKVLAGMLLTFGVVATLVDGNEVLVKVNYVWLLIWFPIGLLMVKEPSNLA